MSFVDVLRKARSSPIATLHKFITNYDPSSRRVYVFVEGEPDKVYYRHHINQISGGGCDVFVYNCEGKARVFTAFRDVTSRYPDCRRVLFFVDKDLDDLVGVSWPSDPRVFVTDFYSVESDVVCADACRAYFRDFVKIRRVEIDLNHLVAEFDEQQRRFHAMMTAPTAWVIAFRRRGGEILLNDVQLEDWFEFAEGGIRRRRGRCVHNQLKKLRRNAASAPSLREITTVTRRLKSLDSRSYVRGHFDAWCFVATVNRMSRDLQEVAAESKGSVSINTPLTQNNLVQLLGEKVKCPARLDSFLRFHLSDPRVTPPTVRMKPWRWFRKTKS